MRRLSWPQPVPWPSAFSKSSAAVQSRAPTDMHISSASACAISFWQDDQPTSVWPSDSAQTWSPPVAQPRSEHVEQPGPSRATQVPKQVPAQAWPDGAAQVRPAAHCGQSILSSQKSMAQRSFAPTVTPWSSPQPKGLESMSPPSTRSRPLGGVTVACILAPPSFSKKVMTIECWPGLSVTMPSRRCGPCRPSLSTTTSPSMYSMLPSSEVVEKA